MTWLSKVFGKKDTDKKKIEMLQIIDEQLSGRGNQSNHLRWIVTTINKKFTSEDIEELKQDILSFEQSANNSAEPLPLLRSAIMDMVDSSALNSALLELKDNERRSIAKIGEEFLDGIMLNVYLSSEFQTACLRLYCFAKYDDGGQKDWFTLYTSAAKENGKHMARILLASVDKYDGDPTFLVLLHAPHKAAMAELRTKLLVTPVGATFPD
jgi:hypothetical protein